MVGSCPLCSSRALGSTSPSTVLTPVPAAGLEQSLDADKGTGRTNTHTQLAAPFHPSPPTTSPRARTDRSPASSHTKSVPRTPRRLSSWSTMCLASRLRSFRVSTRDMLRARCGLSGCGIGLVVVVDGRVMGVRCRGFRHLAPHTFPSIHSCFSQLDPAAPVRRTSLRLHFLTHVPLAARLPLRLAPLAHSLTPRRRHPRVWRLPRRDA